MRKKPIPELVGDDEYLRQHHVIEMSVGALQVFRVAKIDDDNSRDEPVTASELFSGGLFFGADELLADVRKAGFPKYPVRAAMAELEKIAEQYVRAAPNIKDPKNLPASYAWVLAQFADVEYYRQKFMSENNIVEVWGMGVLMGRLVDWWNWRSQEHDRNAVLGHEQREANRRRGKQPKRREWADILAERVSSWDQIPDSRNPLEIETLEADLIFYRDGKHVICAINGKEKKLARSTFEKNYLRPALRQRGQ